MLRGQNCPPGGSVQKGSVGTSGPAGNLGEHEGWPKKHGLERLPWGFHMWEEREPAPPGGPASPQLWLWAEFPQTAEVRMEMNQT